MRLAILSVSNDLHKFPSEVEEEFTLDDLAEFVAYKKIVNEQATKAKQPNVNVAGRSRRPRGRRK